MQDQEIIDLIRKGRREKPIKQLYKEFPKIKNNILKSGGNKIIAEEIFNDSLMLLIEKVSNPDFVLTSKLTTYLFGINRFLWKNELRKQNKHHELEWTDTLIISADDIDYNEEKEEKLNKMEQILSTISDKCKQIINLFYYQNMKMVEIAERLGYTSVNSAKTQKYKCMERAIQMANETNKVNLKA